ncbi:hypothetical protein [Thermomonas sp.]|uniref:hypothetical protein n=1 Tax=Thermomonas sp. TaxID=1971895 RepID=UPI002BCC78BE|nr:hypothetical protein [Thermomonas sp.]HRO62876.1 hypothetical protein [Thermomonas sp.]
MTIKQFFRPALAATAVGLLLVTLNALGSDPGSGSDASSDLPTAAGAAASDLRPDGDPPRRLSAHRLRHSLRMPFFSFQPLG